MNYFITRKLIKLGQGALVITVPKLWVDRMKLRAGDKVEMVISNNLTIRRINNEGKKGSGSCNYTEPMENHRAALNGSNL